MTVRNGD